MLYIALHYRRRWQQLVGGSLANYAAAFERDNAVATPQRLEAVRDDDGRGARKCLGDHARYERLCDGVGCGSRLIEAYDAAAA